MLPVSRTNSLLSPTWNGFNRLDTFFDRVLGEEGQAGQAWGGLPVAMWQDDDQVNIEIELPGVAENDVEVTVHNKMLFIRGERKPAEGRQYLYNGRTFGRFERIISLPEEVNSAEVQATLSNGVLHVALPKSPEAKPRKITVRTN